LRHCSGRESTKFIGIITAGVRGWTGAALVALAFAALAVGGAAATGHAAASPGVEANSFTVINNDSDKFQPSPGGNIGYDIKVSNDNGTSIANHVSLTETIGTGTLGTPGTLHYVSASVIRTGPRSAAGAT
jgi:uncharacterized repeat protein (TIGR01451 family)